MTEFTLMKYIHYFVTFLSLFAKNKQHYIKQISVNCTLSTQVNSSHIISRSCCLVIIIFCLYY